MSNGLPYAPRPKSYRPPSFKAVEALLTDLREKRRTKHAQIEELKKGLRDDWGTVLNQIPPSYRKMAPVMGFPDLAEMGQRIAGLISKQEPIVEVVPPSGKTEDVRHAAAEEARLHAARVTIEDQQSRPTYAMGINSQVNLGESWISVMPDPSRLHYPDDEDIGEDDEKRAVEEAERILGFRRGKEEGADDYMARYRRMMADGAVPIALEDYDPQTVYPFYSRNRLAALIVETEHTLHDIELGLGYKPIKGAEGKADWMKSGTSLSEPFVPESDSVPQSVVDTLHDNPDAQGGASNRGSGRRVTKVCYFDAWVIQTYLDGVLVEQWEHDWGFVPMFGAFAEQNSDREPGQESRAVIQGAHVIARQLVLWAAMLTANAKLHAYPTPFLQNPEHGASVWQTREPAVRQVRMGELNLLGPNEEIKFPYLDARMGPDFFANLEFLIKRFESITLQNWGTNLAPDTSGYAIAQMRALQQSALGPVYANAASQWRRIFACIRHIVETHFPTGIYLRGAVESEDKDGVEVQYSPILTYAKKNVTHFMINVRIDEGIIQDELAMRKSALEMHQGGAWSMRRVREETGVEDPVREQEEVDIERLMNSPAMDQQVVTLAMAMAAKRFVADRTAQSTPFMQALEQAQQQVLGVAAGQGQFDNQGGQPQNALPGGQPVQQSPTPAAPQQGGPMAGAPPIEQLGAAGLPGGVPGGTPPAVM